MHSLDGAVSVDGASAGLGSPGDKRIFDLLRAWADAVLVGHGTASAEGYGPVAADTGVVELRRRLGRPAARRSSWCPAGPRWPPATGWRSPPPTWSPAASADADRRAALAEAGVRVLVCGDDDVDLPAALDALAADGLEQVLCEGGPALFRSAVAAGVVDELCLTTAPLLAGGAPGLLGDPGCPGPGRPG